MKRVKRSEYNVVKRMSKKSILAGILYKIHSLSERDDKWTLTNGWFASRYGEFEVEMD